ncbi:MAG: hypothetical protein RSD40_04190 [Bacilli bacterium]
MKKQILLSIILLLIVTGCTSVKLNNNNYDTLMKTVLNQKPISNNASSRGYTYYLPRGLSLVDKNEYNHEIRDDRNRYYLYVDIIRYYHKDKIEFTPLADAVYSKKIEYLGNEGYLEITKKQNFYFIEAMYHYAKVEAYVLDSDLTDAFVNIFTILKSVHFNDDVLNTLIGENVLNYQVEKFNIMKPNREIKDFLDYVNEYDKYKDDNIMGEGEEDIIIKDEDTIKLDKFE